MDAEKSLIDGLILYLCFIPVITLHEFAHAWMSWKRGDPTAYNLGRVTINPASHIDPIGTVAIPLIALFLTAFGGGAIASFLIGWGKPVPVDPSNLKHRRVDDTLIAMAGPLMNILLALVFVVVAKGAVLLGFSTAADMCEVVAVVSLSLCFFNMLPIPPLDGSHLIKNAIGMSEETYWRLSQFGIVILIIALQFTFVRSLIWTATMITLGLMKLAVKL